VRGALQSASLLFFGAEVVRAGQRISAGLSPRQDSPSASHRAGEGRLSPHYFLELRDLVQACRKMVVEKAVKGAEGVEFMEVIENGEKINFKKCHSCPMLCDIMVI
jgi:hypothetical protein